jgi:hypothetical protein
MNSFHHTFTILTFLLPVKPPSPSLALLAHASPEYTNYAYNEGYFWTVILFPADLHPMLMRQYGMFKRTFRTPLEPLDSILVIF